jgi:hypothetical protein
MDILKEISFCKCNLLINDDWDIVIDNDVLPNSLLRLMDPDVVNAFFVYLLALEHLLQDAVLLANQIESSR